jgi:hypothetical protein
MTIVYIVDNIKVFNRNFEINFSNFFSKGSKDLGCQSHISCRDLHTPTEGERGSRMGFSVPLKTFMGHAGDASRRTTKGCIIIRLNFNTL